MKGVKNFTKEQNELFMKLYPTTLNSKLLQVFPNKKIQFFRRKACKMGLKKDPGFRERYDYGWDGPVIAHLSEKEKAYLAGIIDGEGCIGFYHTSHAKGYSIYVTIANTDKRLMDWLTSHVPSGHVYIRRKNPDKNWSAAYSWVLYGSRKVSVFCRELMDYLILKKDQASLVSSGYRHLGKDEREKMMKQLKKLKET